MEVIEAGTDLAGGSDLGDVGLGPLAVDISSLPCLADGSGSGRVLDLNLEVSQGERLEGSDVGSNARGGAVNKNTGLGKDVADDDCLALVWAIQEPGDTADFDELVVPAYVIN